MTSPSVQHFFSDAGGVSPGTGAFAGTQTAGGTNAICLRGDPYSGTPAAGNITSVTDSGGNAYTPRAFAVSHPAGGQPGIWIYTCEGIAAHAAGSIVTVAFTGTFFLQIIGIEYLPTGAFRVANGTGQFSGSVVPIATTLAGTVTGDLVCMASWAFSSDDSTAGSVGANAANVVYSDVSAGHNWAAQDGLSDGSSPLTAQCGGVNDNFYAVVAASWAQAGGGGGGGSVSDPPWAAAHRSRRNTLLRMAPERERVSYAGRAFSRQGEQRLFHAA